MKQLAALFAPLFLFGCAPSVITKPPVPFENTYTAENTYQKEVKHFPHIEIASPVTPDGVRVERDVTYVQYGRRALQLDLHRPETGRRRPAVVLVHGGGWRSGYRENLTPLANALAERGFVVANISYRLAPEARFPAAIHDVKAAIRWLRAHADAYGVNPNQIAVGGTSAGGQIASLTGITAGDPYFDLNQKNSSISSDVQAILNIDGLSDFTSEEARYYEDDPSKNPSSAGSWFGGRYSEQTGLWHKGSPIYYVHGDMPPILFLNSAQERFGVGRDEMIAKMKPLGVEYHVRRFDDTPHTFWLFDPWLQPTADEIAAFLQRVWSGSGSASE